MRQDHHTAAYRAGYICLTGIFTLLFVLVCFSVPSFALSKDESARAQTISIQERPVTYTDKFAVALENTDSYLYRIGNSDTVSLGSLFEELTGDDVTEVDDETVTITVTPQNTENGASVDDADSSLTCTYTADTDTWENGTLKFSKTGVVTITIQDETSNPVSLLAEVVNGYNFESGETVSSKSANIVLLGDCEISDSGTLSVRADYALYGNGFTLDVSMGSITALGIVSVYGIVDNTQIVGDIYTTYGSTYGSDYNAATVILYDGGEIKNSYVSGSRAAIRVAGDSTIEDSTIAGGLYSNIDCRGGALTLAGDVITINEPLTDDSGTTIMGFGIVINYEISGDVTIDVTGTLTQYNWICSGDKSYFASDFQSYISNFINSGDDYVITYTSNSTKYVNLGILSLNSEVGESAVTGTNYTCYPDSYLGNSGYLWSYDKDSYSITAEDMTYRSDVNSSNVDPQEAWTASGEIPSLPSYTWSYPTDEEGSSLYNSTNSALVFSFESGDTYTLSGVSGYLTAAKHGNTLSKSVSVESPDGVTAVTYDSSADTITFSEGGTYTISYTFTDPMIYDAEGVRTGETAAYTKTLSVQVTATEAGIEDPVFTFTDKGGNTYEGTVTEINGLYYVMPSVSATSDYVSSTTVSSTTVYYVITEGEGEYQTGSNIVRHYPLFSAVTITDYTDTDGTSVTYDADTHEVPDGMETIQDQDDTSGWSYGSLQSRGWDGYDDYEIDGTTYYCMQTEQMSYDSWYEETTVWAKYSFTAGNGVTYYYIIGYHLEEVEKSTCFPTGTLITLSDGTQVPVEELTGEEELLVYDHESGTYAASSILFIEDSGDDEYEVVTLSFSDGTTTGLIYEHAYFDLTRNQYVYINDSTLYDYLGDTFVLDDGGTLSSAVLEEVTVETEYTGCYSLVTAYQLNYFVDGLLSIPGGIDGLFNIFEYGDALQYDQEKMQADIEEYGLFTYADFEEYISEEVYEVFGGKYLKVSIGKGLITFDGILKLIDRYSVYFDAITDATDLTGEDGVSEEMTSEEESSAEAASIGVADEEEPASGAETAAEEEPASGAETASAEVSASVEAASSDVSAAEGETASGAQTAAGSAPSSGKASAAASDGDSSNGQETGTDGASASDESATDAAASGEEAASEEETGSGEETDSTDSGAETASGETADAAGAGSEEDAASEEATEESASGGADAGTADESGDAESGAADVSGDAADP